MRHYLDEWIVLACRGKLLPPPRPNLLVFNWRKLLHNTALASAVHQHEPAICIHVSPSSLTSLSPPTPSHPSRLLQSPSLSSLSHMANSHWLFILHMVEVRFLRQSPYLTFFAIWIGDIVKIIVTVLQTIKRKVTSDICGTQTLKDFNINSH